MKYLYDPARGAYVTNKEYKFRTGPMRRLNLVLSIRQPGIIEVETPAETRSET